MSIFETSIDRPAFSRSALFLSVLLHALLVYLLLHEELLWTRLNVAATPQITVDLVPDQPKPPPRRPPPPPKEEAPKPEPPKPALPEPPVMAPPKPVPPPPLSVPQLVPAPIAKQSSVPHPAAHNGAEGEAKAMAMASGPALSLGPKGEVKMGPHGVSGPVGPALTQSEQDFILAQVMKFWHIDLHAPEAHGLVLEGEFLLQADGTLASPFNKNDPWDPTAVVRGYQNLGPPGISFRRDAMDAFLLALKLCQPLQLPTTKGPWPRKIVIRFAFDSL